MQFPHLAQRRLALCTLLLAALNSATAQEPADDEFVLQEAAYLSQHVVQPTIRWAPCATAPNVATWCPRSSRLPAALSS